MKVQALMTTGAITCRTDDSLNRAAQLMWEYDCGSLPVVDDSGSARGMITDRDICMAAYTRGVSLHEIRVDTAMSPQLFVCSPEDAVEAAESLMRLYQVRRIPVVEGGQLVGMLSMSDLLLHSSHDAQKVGALRPEALVRTLVGISAPASPSVDRGRRVYGAPSAAS